MKGLWECGVELRTRDEMRNIARASALAAAAICRAGTAVRPGVAVTALRDLAERYAARRGAADIRVYTSVNSTAAHGLPDGAVLRDGDIVTVDVSVLRGGWYGDVAWSFVAGRPGGTARRLLAAAWEAAWRAVQCARGGVRLSELSRCVRATAGSFGCAVAEECSGHGIGRALHEAPAMGYADPRIEGYLVPGMVFTVEPVLTAGSGLLREGPRGGLVTADGSLAAQFELPVAVLAEGPTVLCPLGCDADRGGVDTPTG